MTAMIERTGQYVRVESKVKNAYQIAMLKVGGALLISNILGVFNKDRVSKLFNDSIKSSKVSYHAAVDELRTLEAEEDYPTVRAYTESILEIAGKLPDQLRQKAYCPYAGTDIFWSSGFTHLVMEDRNYDSSQDDPSLWWRVEDYSAPKLKAFVNELIQRGIIQPGHNVTFEENDSKLNSKFRFNRSDTTLIYKAGHDFKTYIETVFKNLQINFGAIIISNDRILRGD